MKGLAVVEFRDGRRRRRGKGGLGVNLALAFGAGVCQMGWAGLDWTGGRVLAAEVAGVDLGGCFGG